MTDTIDTSAEAVERLAAGADYDQRPTTAAALRALAAERDRLAAEKDAVVATLAAYRMENGCTRGQRTTQWCAEASVLRAAWLRVIQGENACVVTGQPCHAKRCGCKAEQDMLIKEADEAQAKAALAGDTP